MFSEQPFENDEEKENFDKIKEHIEEFDQILINSLMLDREKKYHSRYRPELVEDQSMQESLNVNDTSEGAIDISKQKNFGRKKKSGEDYKVGV